VHDLNPDTYSVHAVSSSAMTCAALNHEPLVVFNEDLIVTGLRAYLSSSIMKSSLSVEQSSIAAFSHSFESETCNLLL
jgi:hypothetical protein